MQNIKKCLGIDLSINSPGLVALDLESGAIIKWGYLTALKKFMLETSNTSIHVCEYRDMKKSKDEETSPDLFSIKKKAFLVDFVGKVIDSLLFHAPLVPAKIQEQDDLIIKYLGGKPNEYLAVAMEGYAYGASNSSCVFDLAEIGGYIKLQLWKRGIPLRMYDPLSVKLWATNHGHAKKFEMVNAARELGFDIPEDLFASGSKMKVPMYDGETLREKDLTGPGTDVADAFHIASMLRTEILVRNGVIKLEDLTEKQRRVFLRTTTHSPINLLAQNFIINEETTKC